MRTKCFSLALLLVATPGSARAQPNTGTSQGGGLLNAGAPLIVTAADARTIELIRSRRPGPGRMTIQVERGSELAKLFREQLASAPRRPIPWLHLEFSNVTFFIPEADRPATASAARIVLEEVSVIKILDTTTRGSPVSEVTISHTKAWGRGYPIKWKGPLIDGG